MRRPLASVAAFVLSLASLHAEQVVFSEVMYHPADTRPEFIEIWNISNTPLDFAKWRFTDGITYEFPDFNSGTPQNAFLKAGERIVVSSGDPTTTRNVYGIPANIRIFGPWSGSLDSAGEFVQLTDKNGVGVCTLDYKDGGRWPKAADGAGYSLVLRNENNPIDDWRNWRRSQNRGGTPGVTEGPTATAAANPEVVNSGVTNVTEYNSAWKHFRPTVDPGTAWRNLGFDDSTWGEGVGLLGFTSAPGTVPAPGVQTSLPAGNTTYLFRKTFTFTGNPASVTYEIDQIIDDGVYYYLNGQPLGGIGFNTGGAWDSIATRTVGNPAVETGAGTGLNGAPTGLVTGTNVLSADMRNVSTGSSDLIFGAKFKLSSQSELLINEVKPGSAGQGFVELFNNTNAPINLNGHYLSDTPANLTKYQITANLTVPALGYAVVGFSESNLAVGATTTVYITKPDATTVLNAIVGAIPLDGRSLGRNPTGSNSWFLFAAPTPAGPNGVSSSILLNEVHFAANGQVDWVELQNAAASTRSVSNLSIASLADFSDKVALSGTVTSNGQQSFPVSFTPDSGGDLTLYLIDSTNNVLDVADLEHRAGLDSIQAIHSTTPVSLPTWQTVKTATEWFSSETATENAPNNPPINTAVVINEIMCDPPSDQSAGEFVELHNRSGTLVSLAGWKLRGGIDFDFPPGASIPIGGYIVVGANTAYLQSAYPGATVVGNWTGVLGNNGDLIRVVDQRGNLVDEVDYKVGGDWPELAGGDGSTLELVNPNMDNSRASAWRASNESTKTTFQDYTISGPFQQLASSGGLLDKELHMHLVGDAHCIVRNVSIVPAAGGSNLIANGTVLSTNGSSTSGWLCQGTHYASFMNAGELNLVADGHGDNRPNRAEIDCQGLTQNVSYNITFQARWVSGKPRLLVQTWDHSLGASISLPVPNNLGTAGAANSRFAASAPPQVDSVVHSPAVPKSTDPVRVTARVTSTLPLTAVELLHRIDDAVEPLGTYTVSLMYDDGSNGDAIAGDGIYTITVTSHQVNNRIVRFYVRATAQGGATAELPKGGPNRPGLWMVDNRTIDAQLRRQRFVLSAYHRDALTTASGQSTKFQFDFPRLSNHYHNATFIHNESDVYYNAEIRKSGSPWTRPDDSLLERGKWKVPPDRTFRGREKFTFDNDATNSTTKHHNRLIRYWLYVLGHPVNEGEFVYNLINTDGVAVREDTEPVDGEMVSRNFPNGNQGQLMRSDDEWWFADDWSRNNRDANWSYKSTDLPWRYHTEWMMRSREEDYDYSSLTEFFKTVSNGSSTQEQLNRVIDSNLTLMMAAVRGYAYDWDSLTLNRGKNGYFYRRPDDGRWMLLHWDSDLAFQDASNIVVGGLAGWSTFANRPTSRRTLNYYLTEMLKLTSGANSARSLAFLDAEEAASAVFTVNKAFYQTWFSNRTSRIQTEINTAIGGGTGNAFTAPFAASGSGGSTPNNAVTVNGTAPSSAFAVIVVGHPEAVVTWTNQTSWQITNLVLATGLNTITLRMVDYLGNVLGTTTYTITKTGNAPPLMTMSVSPDSQNIVLGSQALLDAGGSYDPDAGALTYDWSVTPATGYVLGQPTPSSRTASFSTPGVYSFTATATDPLAASTPITREVTAYSAEDFSSFAAKQLEAFWTPLNIELRDSHSASAYYSLEDTEKSLVMQVFDDSAKTLSPGTTILFPTILRPLPSTADYSLQTDLTLETRRTGSFVTGIFVEMIESGNFARYAFGINGGNNLLVRRMTTSASLDLASPISLGESAVLRIRRVGTQLRFDRRTNGVWTNIFAQTIPAGATAIRGGPFVATSVPQRVRVAFDYVLLADPTNTASVVNNLRITEVMYNPKAPDTVEFIELKNIGAASINLQGVKFDQGAPFDAYTFGNVSLTPGQYIVVTDNLVAFEARYGFAAHAQWPGGNLAGGGEQITLRDADNNPVHDFDYDDVAPWPLAADGEGPSLEIVDVNGNYGNGANWRASFEVGGSPGSAGAGPDTDGDGQPDSWEILFGTNPNNPSSRFVVTTTMSAGGQPQISFATAAGRNYRIDYSDSLAPANWQPLATIPGTGGQITHLDTTNPRPAQRFYKVIPLP